MNSHSIDQTPPARRRPSSSPSPLRARAAAARARRRTLPLLLAGLSAAASAQAGDSPYLFGDWSGERTRLAEQGVVFSFGYGSESAHNFTGGDAHLTRYTDQWSVGATLDLGKLLNWDGATFQISYSDRNGRDLGADARIGNYQLIQEVYGRGQTVHLSDFWLEQTFLGDRLHWKFGRMTVGEDFASASCDFQNLTFCGSQPGNLVGNYWVNWPTSQWATRLRFDTSADTYVQVGAYQVNPTYIDNRYARRDGWKPDLPGGTTGALFPLEFGWTPTVNGLPGTYQAGVWYTNSGAPDVFSDVDGRPLVLTGRPARQRHGSYGGYVNLSQQVSGHPGADGVTLNFRLSRTDRYTAATDQQITFEIEDRGVFGRPRDFVGAAIGATHANTRLSRAAALTYATDPYSGLPLLDYEYVGEVFYNWSPAAWLDLRPNIQYVRHPGATSRDDAVVLGLKTAIAF